MDAPTVLWEAWREQVKHLFPSLHGHQQKALAWMVLGVVLSDNAVLQRMAESLYISPPQPKDKRRVSFPALRLYRAVRYTAYTVSPPDERERNRAMSTSKRGPVSGSEQAKHGSQAVRQQYGADYFRQIGQKGGQRVKEKQGADFYAEIGRKGGEATKAHYGPDFYRRIGKMGGERGRKSQA